jgi:hypothetical protein
MFEPPRGLPRGVLIHFVSRVNKIRVQMWISDQCDNCHVIYRALLFDMIFTTAHTFCRPCSQNVPVLPADGPLGAETCSSVTVWIQWCWCVLVHQLDHYTKQFLKYQAAGMVHRDISHQLRKLCPLLKCPDQLWWPTSLLFNQHWDSLSGMQLWPRTSF